MSACMTLLSLSLSLIENIFINISFDITAPFALFVFSPSFSISPFSALSSSPVETHPHSSSLLVLPPGARPMVASGASPPVDVALSCSKKRTCTTTCNGRRSFWTACLHTSGDHFLQSISLKIRFFSLFSIPGCSCKYFENKSSRLIRQTRQRNEKSTIL
ncbi:hypothetical protein HanIR_Chr06g0280701 [Helianthus annuus]|nr:hypothetical protein HanIR_Chr06g0280701 [Helianthus annuus]